jgi:hypothetical protein
LSSTLHGLQAAVCSIWGMAGHTQAGGRLREQFCCAVLVEPGGAAGIRESGEEVGGEAWVCVRGGRRCSHPLILIFSFSGSAKSGSLSRQPTQVERVSNSIVVGYRRVILTNLPQHSSCATLHWIVVVSSTKPTMNVAQSLYRSIHKVRELSTLRHHQCLQRMLK